MLHLSRLNQAERSSRAYPVLFLHGFMGSSDNWKRVAAGLDGEAWGLDLPGHGRSIQPKDVETVFEALPALIARTLSDHGLDIVDLIGYSMGARIGLAFKLFFPARVRCLVLESGSPGISDPSLRLARRRTDQERAELLRTDFRRFLERWYDMDLFRSIRKHPALYEATILERLQGNPELMADALRRLGTGSQPSYWSRIGALEDPVHLIVGGLDGKYVTVADEMAAMSDRITCTVVPNTGHNVHLERPKVYLDLLKSVLSTPH